MPAEMIRVLLADDHAVVRKGIREFRKGLNGEGEDKKDELPKA